MSSIDTRATQLTCITCPPPPPDAPALWTLVSWTGWGVMFAAVLVIVVACARLACAARPVAATTGSSR